MSSQPPVRFKGLVRLARQVREQLEDGIPEKRLSEFRNVVRRSIEVVEKVCADTGASTAALLTPSRKAFQFLKEIDLVNLPVAKPNGREAETVSISNAVGNLRKFHRHVNDMALENSPAAVASELILRVKNVSDCMDEILSEAKTGPHALPMPTRRAYSLFKFLCEPGRLEAHVETVARFLREARRFTRNGAKLNIEIGNIGHLFTYRRSENEFQYRISQGFMGAEDFIIHALLESIHQEKSKEARKKIQIYQDSEAYSTIATELELLIAEPAIEPLGRVYNLDNIFDSVNREYFDGEMPRPRLRWSARKTFRKFGHYRFATDEVMLSTTLDSPKVSRFLVEFIMYHELLHKKHGQKLQGSRFIYHSPDFRRDEQKFKRYEEAEKVLSKLARASARRMF